MSKRYVLLLSTSDLSKRDFQALSEVIGKRHPGAKVIPVAANSRAAIVKTTNAIAPVLRDELRLEAQHKTLRSVLTSGAIGNLKKRASEAAAIGKVPK